MRHILVTGSHGFIGTWVRAEIESRGDLAIGYDHPFTVLALSELRHQMEHVDAVINLAGVLGTSETIAVDRGSVDVNIVGAVNVYDAAAERGIPVVQIATGHRGQLNPYAITKACAEDLAVARARWLGQRISVVRAFHVYGAGQKAPPPYGTATVSKIVPTFVSHALAGRHLDVNGSGLQHIDLVWVGDVAKVLVDAIDGPYGDILEAGTGKSTTVNDCAATIIQACGSISQVSHVPMRKGEPAWSSVIAAFPLCENPWPYMLDETIESYRASVQVSA